MSFLSSKSKTPSAKDTDLLLSEAERIFAKGLTTLKDIVAPAALEFGQNYIKVGERYARTMFIFAYPRYLSTNWFSPVINMDAVMDISMHIHPVDTGNILKKLRKKVAEVESQIAIEEERGMVRDPILETAYEDLEELRDKLQQASSHLFQFSLYITVWARTPEELDKLESVLRSLLEGKLVYAKPAVFQQDEAFRSVMPFDEDWLNITSNLDSESLATIFPFVSFDLTTDKGVLYGVNRHNNSLVIFDRFSLPNANTVVFGQSGGGKSYAMKLEILRSLMTNVDVIIIDPEKEYERLAQAVGGSHFDISLTSQNHINPFDLPRTVEGESQADLFRSHLLELTGLVRIMVGQITESQAALIDTAVEETYASRNITPESDFKTVTPPVLADFITVLESLVGGEDLAARLRKFTQGTSSGFIDQPSNIDLNNNLVVFNIRDLEDSLRPIAMYMILHHIWNVVRSSLKKRILVVDEAWWVMQYEDGGSFLYSIAKRARKYYLGLSTITQDVNDFMKSKYGQPIITNSSLQILFKQSPATIDAVKEVFNLTDEEKYLLLEAAIGEGLFFAGLKHVAIKVVSSYTEDQIITSNPEQLIALKNNSLIK